MQCVDRHVAHDNHWWKIIWATIQFPIDSDLKAPNTQIYEIYVVARRYDRQMIYVQQIYTRHRECFFCHLQVWYCSGSSLAVQLRQTEAYRSVETFKQNKTVLYNFWEVWNESFVQGRRSTNVYSETWTWKHSREKPKYLLHAGPRQGGTEGSNAPWRHFSGGRHFWWKEGTVSGGGGGGSIFRLVPGRYVTVSVPWLRDAQILFPCTELLTMFFKLPSLCATSLLQ